MQSLEFVSLFNFQNIFKNNLLWEYRIQGAFFLWLVIVLETIVRYVKFNKIITIKNILANFSILGFEVVIRSVTYSARIAAAFFISRYSIMQIGNGLFSIILLYVLVDFIYYWRHRFLHSTKLGWAVHSTHHSSEEMTILATFRLSWIEAGIRDFFYMPLLILGFDPFHLLFIVELNAISQFWCHTDAIGPIKYLDSWLNTPFNHRIHHAKAIELSYCNFGSTLMIWDKIFGTYKKGQSNLVYGIYGIKESFNPFVLEFQNIWRLIRSKHSHT